MHPRYGAVLDRLRAAGRDSEVIGWLDRAAREGRVSGRLGRQGREYRLDPGDVATTFLTAGRVSEALDVLRAQVQGAPSFATFDALVCFADPGRGPAGATSPPPAPRPCRGRRRTCPPPAPAPDRTHWARMRGSRAHRDVAVHTSGHVHRNIDMCTARAMCTGQAEAVVSLPGV